MPDTRLPPPDPLDDDTDPSSSVSLTDLLRDALRSTASGGTGGSRRSEVAAPDPSRVAGHFAGVGDTDLLDRAAQHESVRRLLLDISDAREAAEEFEGSGAPASDGNPARLSDAVRSRAIAAFAASAAVGADDRRTPIDDPPTARSSRALVSACSGVSAGSAVSAVSAVSGRRGRTGRTGAAAARSPRFARVAIAATVLVVTGVGWFGGQRRAEAAVLALDGFDRVDAAGAVETAGPRRLTMGQLVATGAGERVALRLTDGARVVLGDLARVSVGCDSPCDGRCGGAVFDVESGGVAVAAADTTGAASPIALRVRSEGRVDVWAGAAIIERDAAGVAVLLLRDGARVRWSPDSGLARELVGPATVRLDGAGGVPATVDAVAAFRDLDYFAESPTSGAPRRADGAIRVAARRWRIREDDPAPSSASVAGAGGGSARGVRTESSGTSAIRFDLDARSTGRVAWAADAPALSARRVDVQFRARASSATSVVVRLDGVEGAEQVVPLPLDAPDARPRLVHAVIELPPSMDATSGSGPELTLSWSTQGTGASVWFEGAAFRAAETNR